MLPHYDCVLYVICFSYFLIAESRVVRVVSNQKINLYRLKGAAKFPKTRLCLVLGDCYVDNVFVVHNNPIDTKISNRYHQYLFELQSIF